MRKDSKELAYYYSYEKKDGEWGSFVRVYKKEKIREIVERKDVEKDILIMGFDLIKNKDGQRDIRKYMEDPRERLYMEIGEVLGVRSKSEINDWFSKCERVSWRIRVPFLSAREILQRILVGKGYRHVKVLVEEGGIMEDENTVFNKNVFEDGVKYPTVVVRRIFTEFFGEGYLDRVEIEVYPTEEGLSPVYIEKM